MIHMLDSYAEMVLLPHKPENCLQALLHGLAYASF